MVCTTVTVIAPKPNITGLTAVAADAYVTATWYQDIAGAVVASLGGSPYSVNGTLGTNSLSFPAAAPGTYQVCVVAA